MDNISLSASTLFHYTKSIENIFGILEHGLYPSYCFESGMMPIAIVSNTKEIIDPKLYFGNEPKGIPMVSFCDIRLSQIQEHSKKFGSYAIGFKKSFSTKNLRRWRVNPVLYLENTNSLVTEAIPFLLVNLNIINTQVTSNQIEIDDLSRRVKTLLDFVKIYEGKMWNRQSMEFENTNTIFYNEREWRYVPNLHVDENESLPNRLDESYAMQASKYQIINSVLQQQYKLDFDIDDIKYLIIKSDSEFDNIVGFIKEKPKFKGFEDYLISRIISMEQINYDF